jgi:tetratricopeptide (TPR) repeat protein
MASKSLSEKNNNSSPSLFSVIVTSWLQVCSKMHWILLKSRKVLNKAGLQHTSTWEHVTGNYGKKKKPYIRISKISNCLLRRLEEARATYQKVLELDSRHSIALGFLGLVYHLMGNLDKAIVKYHEVQIYFFSRCQLNSTPHYFRRR